MDAAWYMRDCDVVGNAVFHALLLSGGNRTTWRQYLNNKAEVLRQGAPSSSLQQGAAAAALSLTLVSECSVWWLVNSRLTGNRLLLPASAAAPVPKKAGGAAAPASSLLLLPDSQLTGDPPPDALIAADAEGAGGASARAQDAWSLALPGASYAEALSVLLSADAPLRASLAQGGPTCTSALQAALAAQQVNLAVQPTLRPRAAAALWATFSQGYVAGTLAEGNAAFPHVLRVDNSFVHSEDVVLRHNMPGWSVWDAWYSDLSVAHLDAHGNVAAAGGVLDFESLRGSFSQVRT